MLDVITKDGLFANDSVLYCIKVYLPHGNGQHVNQSFKKALLARKLTTPTAIIEVAILLLLIGIYFRYDIM